MKEKLAILVWAADPGLPHLCATPFYFASAAAAMDIEVEMFFTARSVRLLVPGVAEALYPEGSAAAERGVSALPVAYFLREAHDFGVRFLACPAALRAHVAADETLRAEVDGQAGAAAFVGRSMDPAWSTLSF